ncbi:peptidase inhibitor family I36 protein [Kibdelosporangium lantanae]|uniref:Peptidase inhibitor family I36 protein n=1 Tax=Kibdelosporangium lantanae TaxID=1497396 RepID=A0ABW3M9T0_9PSEU
MAVRKKLAALGVGVLSAAALLAAPGVASATTWDSCKPHTSCYFSDSDGGGLIWTAPSSGRWDLRRDVNPPFNDQISSVWNRGGGPVRLYNWTGSYWEWVATAEVGQQLNWYHRQWPFPSDKENDIVDLVCVDVASTVCP